MIGKPEWFQRRKYGGWGIIPKTWQGWVYLACVIIPFAVFQSFNFWSTQTRVYVTIAWAVFLLFDVTHIMIFLKKDEREHKIEAIAERNSAWAMVIVLAIGISYQAISSGIGQKPNVDPFLVAAILFGLIAKAISNIILERKAL
jgi:putative Mn2+ efflux pump MntP